MVNKLCAKPAHLSSILGLGLVLLAGSNPAYAGNGSFVAGTFNFVVSVRFDATEAELEQIGTAFERASQILADATDDQHRFGTITIVNDSGASELAEYWVHPGAGWAYATGGRYGARGEHVNLYFDSNLQGNNGEQGDAYAIAHLHAHHAYDLYDSYAGPDGAAEGAPPPDTETLSYSLMDNFYTRGGRAFGDEYTLNEFSVASNHDPDGDTWQTAINGESDWETIGSARFPIVVPGDLPVEEAPPAHEVDVLTGSGDRRVMLLMDRSGSMGSNNRLTFAKAGATQFVTLAKDGDRLGIASFNENPSLDFPLLPVSPETRFGAYAAIDAFVASGSTNIGGGLEVSLGAIVAQPDRSVNETIVLLSDGDHNTGPAPETVIPRLAGAGVSVVSIGVGSGISVAGEASLQRVAARTGGRYFRLANAFQLIGLFLQLSTDSFGSGLILGTSENVVSDDEKEVPVLVETGSQAVTLAMTFASPRDEVKLALISPSGTVITEADAAIDPNIEFFATNFSKTFRIILPEDGVWQMVLATGAVTDGLVQLLAISNHPGVQLNASTATPVLQYPDATIVRATPQFEGENVIGASVSGNVRLPGGDLVPITLFDDGLPEHGDAIPDDGTYSARFDAYDRSGTYIFSLTSESQGAVSYAGEELFDSAGAPPSTKAVPDFVRSATTTVVVIGVP